MRRFLSTPQTYAGPAAVAYGDTGGVQRGQFVWTRLVVVFLVASAVKAVRNLIDSDWLTAGWQVLVTVLALLALQDAYTRLRAGEPFRFVRPLRR